MSIRTELPSKEEMDKIWGAFETKYEIHLQILTLAIGKGTLT